MVKENLNTPYSIRTYSGQYFNMKDIDPDTILIEDIAHALSMQCRFGSHLPTFYSVGQHSVHCWDKASPPNKKAALLHDASEAYMFDMPSPFKVLFPEFVSVEEKLMGIIADKFGFKYPLVREVKDIDYEMLITEWEGLMLSDAIKGWDYKMAEERFLNAYYSL